MPIYSGGSVSSLVRQARYEFQQACADMQANFREAGSFTQQSFNNVVSGVSKIRADKQAIVSAQSALDANQAAFKAGTRTIIDVLLAQQNLLSAQQIHAADQYAYLMDTLRLKQAAGTLSGCDLYCINQWLGYRDSERVGIKMKRFVILFFFLPSVSFAACIAPDSYKLHHHLRDETIAGKLGWISDPLANNLCEGYYEVSALDRFKHLLQPIAECPVEISASQSSLSLSGKSTLSGSVSVSEPGRLVQADQLR